MELYAPIIMRKQLFTLPNCITMLRILGTVILLFIKPLSSAFFLIYTFTGLTDAFDGFAARMTNSVSELGSKLDSVADIVFYFVMLIKISPVLITALPSAIWIAVVLILMVRISAYLVSAIKHRKFASLHTILNKLTGFSLFFVPYIILTHMAVPVCWGISAVGALSSVEELVIHLKTNSAK